MVILRRTIRHICYGNKLLLDLFIKTKLLTQKHLQMSLEGSKQIAVDKLKIKCFSIYYIWMKLRSVKKNAYACITIYLLLLYHLISLNHTGLSIQMANPAIQKKKRTFLWTTVTRVSNYPLAYSLTFGCFTFSGYALQTRATVVWKKQIRGNVILSCDSTTVTFKKI